MKGKIIRYKKMFNLKRMPGFAEKNLIYQEAMHLLKI